MNDLIRKTTDMDDVLDVLNLPMDAFITWIRKEMKHEATLQSEHERVRCYSNSRGDLLVNASLTNLDVASTEYDTSLRGQNYLPYIPSRDAMFKICVGARPTDISMIDIR